MPIKKALLSSFVVFFLSYCNGQSRQLTEYFSYKTDSLDRVMPIATMKVKPLGRAHVIKVQTQQQFDSINERVLTAINEGRTNIVINIGSGVFHFHENHISLNKLEAGNVSITIKGKNTIITSDDDFSDEDYCISPWTEINQADDLIEIANIEKKECFIPFKNLFKDNNYVPYDKVQITQWFKAPSYEIEIINQEGIYFTAPELSFVKQFGREGYSVNYDFLYAGKKPRFRLYDKRKERHCSASCFMKVRSSSLRALSFQGVKFKGNKGSTPLISMSALNALQVTIRNCLFDYIRGKVLDVSNSVNIVFDRNGVTNTAGHELTFSNGCKNVRIIKNRFENCGTCLGNTQCIRCNESEYYIAHNTFCNFGYCAIGVGLWYGHLKNNDTRGIIEYNEIYFAEDYFAHRDKYTLMDAGAIYVWTQNDDAIIRYNYIHDYGGMRFNSGIYCDDGASNCKIYGNVILNTPDGCSISSRSAKDQKEGFQNNTNNLIVGNYIDGAVVFGCSSKNDRHCQKGVNYVTPLRNMTTYKDKFENLELQEEDVVISDNKLLKKQIKRCMRQ